MFIFSLTIYTVQWYPINIVYNKSTPILFPFLKIPTKCNGIKINRNAHAVEIPY